MKWFIDTDNNEEYTLIQIQDLKISHAKALVFMQELDNLYRKLEVSKK